MFYVQMTIYFFNVNSCSSRNLSHRACATGGWGAMATPLFCWTKKTLWQKRFSAFEKVLQLAPLHLLLHKQLVPLRYTRANLKNAPGKAYSCALENQKTKISPLAPTIEVPQGDSKYSTMFIPLTFEIDARALSQWYHIIM